MPAAGPAYWLLLLLRQIIIASPVQIQIEASAGATRLVGTPLGGAGNLAAKPAYCGARPFDFPLPDVDGRFLIRPTARGLAAAP